MKKIFRNRLNRLAAKRSKELQFCDSFVAQLRMNRRTLDRHLSGFRAAFVVECKQRIPLRPAGFPDPFIEQFRDGCLCDTDCRRDICLSHTGVKEVLND